MSAYRFCRTDDIGLLVDALNHCWAPYHPDEPPATPAAFKRTIRDPQVWCSSCMVAFSGNGLLSEDQPQVCWERSVETLTARKDDIAGLAVATDERIETYVLYVSRGAKEADIMSLRSSIDDGGVRLKQLLSQLRARGIRSFQFPKVHPAEISTEWLETLGFRRAGEHLIYAATLGKRSGSP